MALEKTYSIPEYFKLAPDWNEKREMDAFDFSVEFPKEKADTSLDIESPESLSSKVSSKDQEIH